MGFMGKENVNIFRYIKYNKQKRKLEVPKPKTNLFVRGIVLFALGLLGASVYTIEDIDKTPALVFQVLERL